MNKKLQLGLIGCGRIAQPYLEATNYLDKDLEFIAVADIDKKRAQNCAGKFGVKQYYLDYKQLIRNPQIDAVIIALPHYLHCQVSLECAKASKHILIEKPIATNVKEADRIITEAKRNKITLMVGQNRRFSDAAMQSYRRIHEIGELSRIIVTFLLYYSEPPAHWWRSLKKTGGLIVPLLGNHSIDFIVWFLKEVPVTVYATGLSKRPSLWEGEDEVDIVMTFGENKLASVHLSMNTFSPVHEIMITGEKGTMRLYEYTTAKPFVFKNRLEINGETVVEKEQIPTTFALQLEEFASSIRENRAPCVSVKEARDAMRVMDAVKQSIVTGRTVYLAS